MNKTTEEINKLRKLKMHESILLNDLLSVKRVPEGLWYIQGGVGGSWDIFVPFIDFEEKYESEKIDINNSFKRDLDIE